MSILDKTTIQKCNSCGEIKETNGDVCEQCWLEGKNTKDDRVDISEIGEKSN